jgi:hypothetical protein
MAHTAQRAIGAKMADKLPKAPRCARCKARLRNTKLLDSMAMLKAGIVDIDDLVCRGCQTDSEHFASESRGEMFEPVISGSRIRLVPRFTIRTAE